MPIRYSSVVGSSSSGGFNLDVGSSGNTTFYFDTPQPAGGYSITSQLADSSIEFYAIAEDGTLAGYTNTKALSAAKDFDTLVVYGATNNDLISFEFKPTTLATANGDQDSGAAPFVTSVSDADLANIDDTTIITGGNFATDVVVTFTGTDAVARNPKSVVRTDSTQLIITRPDEFLEDNSPYILTVSNPGITQSAILTNTSSITAGGDPVWVTSAGALPEGNSQEAYSTTIQANDPDGGIVTYSVISGLLPNGLSLNSTTGEIFGQPTTSTGETQSFTVSASDAEGNITNRQFSISILTTVALGGAVSEADGYRIHTFTSSDTFNNSTMPPSTNYEYLVVAGGGGGGRQAGGGGGAGGLLSGTTTITPGSHLITVGAGGTGQVVGTANPTNGTASSLGAVVSTTGGGGGGGYNNGTGNFKGNDGGSGGGTWSSASGFATGISGQGNNGASGSANGSFYSENSGGGGGAGSAGTGGTSSVSGNGGSGLQSSISGTAQFYAAGGGGGAPSSGSSAGAGGIGGSSIGGDGGGINTLGSIAGENAVIYTGSGGGGGSYSGQPGTIAAPGQGSSGIVIIRYLI